MQHEEFLDIQRYLQQTTRAQREQQLWQRMVKRCTEEQDTPQELQPGKFLSKRFMDEVCYVSDPRCYPVNLSDPDIPIFNKSVSGELLRNMWKP